MAGSWFDAEDLMQRMDYEIYKPPLWQYEVYYILFGVYVVICSLLLYLWQKKIRNAEMMKVPYILIVGEKEEAASSVSVREFRSKKQSFLHS